MLLTAAVVGLIVGAALGVTAGTRRTSSAPDRLTDAAGGDPDLQLTQMGGAPLLDQIEALPGVARTTGFAFVLSFPLAPGDGSLITDLNPFAGDDNLLGSSVVEGRFTDPERPHEFTANRTLADQLAARFGTKVGDSFAFASFSSVQLRSDLDLETAEPGVEPFEATLVGITQSPSDLNESGPQLVFSRAFLAEHPDIAVVQTLIAVYADGGPHTREDLLERVRALPGGADAVSVPLRVVNDSVRRAVRFQSVALWLVSGLALLGAGLVAAQVLGVALRMGDQERRSMRALGATRWGLAAERAVAGAGVGIVAAPIVVAVSYLATAAFPLGVLRSLDPERGPRIDWLVTGVGAIGVVALAAVVGGAAGLAWRAVRPARATAAVTPRAPTMALTVGSHFATVGRRGRRPVITWIGGVLAVAGVVGSLVAGALLTSVVAHPDRWGVNFDQMFGNPYAPADRDIVTPLLDMADVVAATGANLGSLTVDGTDVSTLAFAPAKGRLLPTIIDGRVPRGDREISLGAEVMRRLDVDLRDTVEVRGVTEEARSCTVVGVVVTPDSAGNGAAMPFSSYSTLNPGATQNVVLVNLREGAPDSVVTAVSEKVYSPPDSLPKPTTIAALERVTAAPLLLGGVFAAMLLASGSYLLVASVRARAPEFVALRAMGSVRRQRRSVVLWQTAVSTLAVVVVGVPLGIVIGRRVVGALVSTLGVVPSSDIPLLVIAEVLGATLLVAALVGLVAGQRAIAQRLTRLDHRRGDRGL